MTVVAFFDRASHSAGGKVPVGARRAGRGGNAQHYWPMTQPRQRYQCSAEQVRWRRCGLPVCGLSQSLGHRLVYCNQPCTRPRNRG